MNIFQGKSQWKEDCSGNPASSMFVEDEDVFEWELIEPQSGISYGWANYTVCCPFQ